MRILTRKLQSRGYVEGYRVNIFKRTSSGTSVGTDGGRIVVVEMMVEVIVEMEVEVTVDAVVAVTVTVWSFSSCPRRSLCWAPANKPMKTL